MVKEDFDRVIAAPERLVPGTLQRAVQASEEARSYWRHECPQIGDRQLAAVALVALETELIAGGALNVLRP